MLCLKESVLKTDKYIEMSGTEKRLNLNMDKYKDKGLYLILKDKDHINLTENNIEKVTQNFWHDKEKIPEKLKQVADFKRCEFCPLKDKNDLCDALRPILPFLNVVDKFVSCDEVIAIYRSDNEETISVSNTTMQTALKILSILALTEYCQEGQKFKIYYAGTMPIMTGEEIAIRLYLNMFWHKKGNQKALDKTIANFKEFMTIHSRNLIRRLRLICKNDVFLNAFTNTQITAEILSMDIDEIIKASYEASVNKHLKK